MGLRSLYVDKITPLLKRIPGGSRLNAALVAFSADLRLYSAPYGTSASNRFYTDQEIEAIFKRLDKASIELAIRFMHRQISVPGGGVFVHPEYFFTQQEKEEFKRLQKDFKEACRRYRFSCSEVGTESLYYHHGLRFAPEFVKRNIAGKLFGDVGGYLGDSTLVFMDYSPEKVVIFEPFADCRNKLQAVLKKNGIPLEKYEICPFALSDTSEGSGGMECTTLDCVSERYRCPFGVLKADIEGMGLKFLNGAEQTIRRDRPLLSLSIYHNADEFTGIYQTLESWDLNYHFELKQFSPMKEWCELSLFAYPEEWIDS